MEPPERSVAIIGMDCRFPGSNGLEDFWETLKNEENHITEIPKDRWNIDAFYDENPDAPGKSYLKRAGIIDGIHDWDNVLFDVNEYEAMRMDPQQKLALEVTYNAFQNAGLTEDVIKGTDTAVYMGVMNTDFPSLVAMDTNYADNYTATGTATSLISNRISYTFDLRGPSVTMDSACSSSLVAVNQGINSILAGESNMAVCGGVTIFLGPNSFIYLSKARMASKLGQCHAFSQKADGYVRSEGCGIVILKDAKQALKDKDRIWGYIASSCNSDGRAEHPISNPSKLMQKRLIETAMAKQGLDMHRIQYVEMHGTGTPVGDPTEVGAVGETIGHARKQHNLPPLNIGSVKSNIGHTESAAGIAGIIKTLLMMNKGHYVSSLFYDDLNQSINFDSLHVAVVNRFKEWPELSSGERLASVNSFGFGGTNVHATIQTYKPSMPTDTTTPMTHALICFSGKSETSVKRSMQDTLDAINNGQILNVSNLQYSSMYRRNHFKYRNAIVSKTSLSELKEDLQNEISEFKAVKIKQEEQKINTVFVFSGMGTHWDKMGLELYENVPVFRNIIAEMDGQFFPLAGFKLSQCLHEGVDLSDPVYGQPAIFAVQVGLFAMLRELGVMADVIIGHSMGEVAAAYASNALSLRSAVNVIYHRSRLLGKLHGGAMLAVGGLSVKAVEAIIYRSGLANQVSVAVYSTNDSCTLSGEDEAIDALQQILMQEKSTKIFVKKLDVTIAYHSQYMDPVMEQLKDNLQANVFSAGSEKLTRHISTVSCIDDALQFQRSEYWTKNVRQPVVFDQALTKALRGDSKNVVIEIGPRAPLKRYIEDLAAIEGSKLKHISVMKPNSGTFHFMSMIADIYKAGKTFELKQTAIIPEIVSWPKYGHDKKTLKIFPKKSNAFLENIAEESFEHALITRNVEEECFVSNINKDRASFIFDHVLDQDIIIPGATYVEIAAASAYWEGGRNMFRKGRALAIKVFFRRPCIISKHDIKFPLLKTNLFPSKTKSDVSHWEYDITETNVLHATGEIRVIHQRQQTRQNIGLIKSRCMELFTKEALYKKLKVLRFNHGPKLQCVKSGQQNGSEVLAEVSISDEGYDNYILHPAMLDCIFQLCAMLPATYMLGSSSQVLPFGIENIVIESSPPQNAYAYISISDRSDTMVTVNGEIISPDGTTCIRCSGLKVGIIGKASMTDRSDYMFCQTWKEIDVNATDQLPVPRCMLVSNYSPEVVAMMEKSGLADLIIDIDTILDNEVELQHIFAPEARGCTDVIFAYTSNGTNLTENSLGEEISNIQTNLCYTLLRCITFFQTYNSALQITILTSQVYEVLQGDGPKNVLDGLLGYAQWGMMRTVNTENPFQKLRTLDVSDHQLVTLDVIYQLLRMNAMITETSIKNGIAKCCQFVKFAEETVIPDTVIDATLYRQDAAYLVFGGSKGQGWEIVLDLAKNGAGKIGIVSRNGLTIEKERQIKYLEKETGCTIMDLKADVSLYEQLVETKKLFDNKVPEKPLKGIFMGSVVVNDATIANMKLDMFQMVQKPKVNGIWNVHKLVIDESLDFFVAHSSVVSMLGNPGQTNYAAANAFVDAFMCYRRNKYGVGQSICWGGLDLGLLEDQSKKNKVMSLGIGLLNAREIIQCLHHSLIYNPMLISYAKFNWEAFIRRITHTRIKSYFESLIERKGHYLELSVLTDSDRQKLAKENKDVYIVNLLKTILMVDEDDDIDPDAALLMLGADSQHGTLMYSAVVDSYGEIDGLSPVNVLQMTLNELQLLIKQAPDEDFIPKQKRKKYF